MSQLLIRAGLTPHTVRREIRREIGTGEGPLEEVLPLTPRAAMILSLSIFLAERDEEDDISENHFIMALLQEGESVPVRILMDMGFDVNLWLQHLIMEDSSDDLPDAIGAPHSFDLHHIDSSFEQQILDELG